MSLFERAKQTIITVGREERGAVMVVALIVLLIGALMIPPTLHHIGTGTKAVTVFARQTDQVYAADAGVEYALRWLASIEDDDQRPGIEGNTLYAADYEGLREINGYDVDVEIEGLDATEPYENFKIIATLVDNGFSTTSYANVAPQLSDALNYALVALGGEKNKYDIDLNGQTTINGDIFALGNMDFDNNVTVNGNASATETITGDVAEHDPPYEKTEFIDEADENYAHSPDDQILYDTISDLQEKMKGFHYEYADAKEMLELGKERGDYHTELVFDQIAGNLVDMAVWDFPVIIKENLELDSKVADDFRYFQFNGLEVNGKFEVSNTYFSITMQDTIYIPGVAQDKKTSVNCSSGGTLNLKADPPYDPDDEETHIQRYFIAYGDLNINGNGDLLNPAEFSIHNLPVVASLEGDIGLTSDKSVVEAILWAPNGNLTLSGGSELRGIAIAEQITLNADSSVTQPPDAKGFTPFPAEDGGKTIVTYWRPGNY